MHRIVSSLFLIVLLGACSSSTGEVAGSLLHGEENATSALRGTRPGVLHFWTDDCDACAADEAVLADARAEFSEFAYVSVYVGDDVAAARSAWRSQGELYPLLADTKNELWQGYEVTTLPTTVFLNEEGLVISRVNGPLDAAEASLRLQEIRDLAKS